MHRCGRLSYPVTLPPLPLPPVHIRTAPSKSGPKLVHPTPHRLFL